MKKFIPIISIIIMFVTMNKNVEAEEILIPDNAIRYRVIANSNSVYDQEIKMLVANKIQNEIYDLLKDCKSIEIARQTLINNLNVLKNNINILLTDKNYLKGFNINYGENYFPEKKYKGVKYSEGNYESLLITLGEGKGDNWWCVLFPPLCLMEASESDDIEYKFFVKELINKYF